MSEISVLGQKFFNVHVVLLFVVLVSWLVGWLLAAINTVARIDNLKRVCTTQLAECVFTVVVALVVQPVVGQLTKDQEEGLVQLFDTHACTTAENIH